MAEEGTLSCVEVVPRVDRQRVASDPPENALSGTIGITNHLIGRYYESRSITGESLMVYGDKSRQPKGG
jgi:hypothetical protein